MRVYIHPGCAEPETLVEALLARSKNGKPIIALPSTAKGGKISRILPMLDPGAGVVTSRGSVHYVVTGYGVAYLHGRTIRQRAEER